MIGKERFGNAERREIVRYAGIRTWLALPENFDPHSGRFVIAFHGRGGTLENHNLVREPGCILTQRLTGRGYAVAIPEIGTDHWGNPEARAKTLALADWLRDEYGAPDALPLLGFSMGALTMLKFAVCHPRRAARMVDLFGITDLPGFRQERVIYRESIDAAYGGEPMTQANPMDHTATLAAIPLAIFHGTMDDIVDLQHSLRLFAALRAIGAPVTLRTVSGVGHDNRIAAIEAETIADFLTTKREVKP